MHGSSLLGMSLQLTITHLFTTTAATTLTTITAAATITTTLMMGLMLLGMAPCDEAQHRSGVWQQFAGLVALHTHFHILQFHNSNTNNNHDDDDDDDDNDDEDDNNCNNSASYGPAEEQMTVQIEMNITQSCRVCKCHPNILPTLNCEWS